ncbi:MAG: hypothetical protein HY204_10995 [Nitrospirae bacterium]|nr:hypothetical protein [Nitrospirota bacterium]
MKKGLLILSVACLILFRPGPGLAETRVYVSFSIGGAVAIGAGVLYWSFSYTSQVSEQKPSEENPGRLSSTTDASELNPPRDIQLFSQLTPQPLTAQERTRADFTSAIDGPYAASTVELPLLIFRW